MDPIQPDPKPSDPIRLLPKDDNTTTFEISKKQQQPSMPPSSSVTGKATFDEENDGFRTPVNQLILAITECPPAPRKTRMPLRKRKGINLTTTSITSARKRIQIDPTEEEFDALFFKNDFRGKIVKKGAV